MEIIVAGITTGVDPPTATMSMNTPCNRNGSILTRVDHAERGPDTRAVRADHTPAPGLLESLVAVLVGGLLTSFLVAGLGSVLFAGAIASGDRITITEAVLAIPIIALLRTILMTVIVCRIVAAFGAYVSFIRAFAALLIGSVIGEVIEVATVSRVSPTTGGGSVLLPMLLSWSGFVVTLLILSSTGTRGGPRPSSLEGYRVPPAAPEDWPGR